MDRRSLPVSRPPRGRNMNLARFDLVTLGLFVAVARQAQASAGARSRTTWPVAAASKRISDLEAAVGAPLFFRHAAGVQLTEAGQACYHHRADHPPGRGTHGWRDVGLRVRRARAGARAPVPRPSRSSCRTTSRRSCASIRPSASSWRSRTAARSSPRWSKTAPMSASSPIATPSSGLVTVEYRQDELVIIAARSIRCPSAGPCITPIRSTTPS